MSETMSAESVLEENEGLVQTVVRRMVAARDVEDAAQVGRLGLLYAWEHFDDSRGAKFSTYAAKCVWARVMRWIERDRDLVRVPVLKVRDGVRVFVDGMDAPMGGGRFSSEDGNGFCLADVLAAPAVGYADEGSVDGDEAERVRAVVETLKEPMRGVIKERFLGLGGIVPRDQVAERLGLRVSRERVRQIEVKGLEILRKRLGRK